MHYQNGLVEREFLVDKKIDESKVDNIFSDIEDIENLQEYGTLIYDNKESNIEKFFASAQSKEYAKFIELPYPGSPIGRAPENCLYISFGHLCTIINILFLYPKNRQEFKKNAKALQGNIVPDVSAGEIEIGEVILNNEYIISEESFKKAHISYIDPRSVFRSHKYIRSFNPSKVLILTDVGENGITNSEESLYNIIKKNVIKENIINCNANVIVPSNITNKGVTFGSIECIFLNVQFVADMMEKTPSLSEYLDAILDTINASVSNYFKLVKDVDDLDPFRIRILDNSLLPAVVDELPVYQKDTIFRNITLDATLPTKYQVAAYATHDSHTPSQINHNAISGFSSVSNGYYNNSVASLNIKSQSNKMSDFVSQSIELYNEVFALPFDEPATVDYEKDFFNVLKYYSTDDAYKNMDYHMPIGINLSLEADGIGGFQYGNTFKLTYVPDFVDKYTVFQITNIEHNISIESSWNTKLTAVLRSANLNKSGVLVEPTKKAKYPRDYTMYTLGEFSGYMGDCGDEDIQEVINEFPTPDGTIIFDSEIRWLNLGKFEFSGQTWLMNPMLGQKLKEADEKLRSTKSGNPIVISSAYRPPQHQQDLLDANVRGIPNAWYGGVWQSNHQSGNAVDLHNYNEGTRKACMDVGLYFPMDHEPWHVQYFKDKASMIRDAKTNGKPIKFPPTKSRLKLDKAWIDQYYRNSGLSEVFK